MRRTVGTVVGLWLAALPVSAQTGLSGTWQVESTATSPSWTVFFRMDGPRLTGLVSRCASAQARPAEIYDTRLAGNAVTFK